MIAITKKINTRILVDVPYIGSEYAASACAAMAVAASNLKKRGKGYNMRIGYVAKKDEANQ